MSLYTGGFLSASNAGQPVQIIATASVGTLVHQATVNTGNGQYDEVYAQAANIDSGNAHLLTVQWGGTGTANKMIFNIPAGTVVPIITGLRLNNNVAFRAYADTTNVFNIIGLINTAQ